MIEPPPIRTFDLLDEREDSINDRVFQVDLDTASIRDWPRIFLEGC
jgi:hypothetical protein